jgi:hypothetical protein
LAVVPWVTLKVPTSLFHSLIRELFVVLGKRLPVKGVLALNHEVRFAETPPGVCALPCIAKHNNNIQATAMLPNPEPFAP